MFEAIEARARNYFEAEPEVSFIEGGSDDPVEARSELLGETENLWMSELSALINFLSTSHGHQTLEASTPSSETATTTTASAPNDEVKSADRPAESNDLAAQTMNGEVISLDDARRATAQAYPANATSTELNYDIPEAS